MAYRFHKHYTRDQARALLPQVKLWLKQIQQLRSEMETHEEKLAALLAAHGDQGGDLANRWVKTMAEIKDVLLQFQDREIQLKDLDRGLIDFPAIREGKEVFLCWEKDENDIDFWHHLDAGYAGREPL